MQPEVQPTIDPSHASAPARLNGSLSLRREVVFVSVLTLVAAGLRLAHWDQVAIEHFDEGVYAANFYAGHLDDQFPNRHLYAPPLLPVLIEYSIVLGGGLHAAMWVNLAAGILLVPALWWVGRGWFGPVAGVTAATLCTFSDIHLLYSRTALTDPLLTFFVVLAVYMIWSAICQGGALTLAIASLLVAGAWWTKYNGWLPLAIATVGFVGWLIWGVHPKSFEDDVPASRGERRHGATAALSRRELIKVLGPRWLIVVILSIAGWAPFVYLLQAQGGYAAVAANHARYVGGIANWGSSFVSQARNVLLLEGPLTAIGVIVGAAFCVYSGERTVNRGAILQFLAVTLLALAMTVWLGSSSVLLLMGGWGAWRLFTTRGVNRDKIAQSIDPQRTSESNLAGWMLSAWFIGLLLTTPLYHPYSRLTLPWLASAWLMAGMSASIVVRQMRSRSTETAPSPSHEAWYWPAITVAFAILVWQGPQLMARGVSGWHDRTAMERVAPLIIETAMQAEPTFADNDPDETDCVVYVLGEPAMFVHLSAIAVDAELNFIAQPASSLVVTQLSSDPGFDVYLLVGPHVLADESPLAAIPNITLIDTWNAPPSDLVWLDEFSGLSTTERNSNDPRWQVRLYRVNPE